MYKNKVIICGVDTSKLPLLKEAQKEALLKKSAAGDNFRTCQIFFYIPCIDFSGWHKAHIGKWR